MNTTENNKLIAEFMGLEFILSPEFGRSGKWRLTNSPYSKIFTQSHAVYLDFDNSWSWLMPVVEKIESLGYWTQIKGGADTIVDIGYINSDDYKFITIGGTKLEATYSTVVKFIEWYNVAKKY